MAELHTLGGAAPLGDSHVSKSSVTEARLLRRTRPQRWTRSGAPQTCFSAADESDTESVILGTGGGGVRSNFGVGAITLLRVVQAVTG